MKTYLGMRRSTTCGLLEMLQLPAREDNYKSSLHTVVHAPMNAGFFTAVMSNVIHTFYLTINEG